MKRKGEARIAGSFEATAWKTERSAAAVLMHWMREIIEQENLDLGLPDVETSGADRGMPDMVIYESRRSENVLCVIETKLPFFNVYNEEELKEPARKKATKRHARFFALTNYKSLIWFKTYEVNSAKPIVDQIANQYTLSEVEDVRYLEQTRYREPTRRVLRAFLRDLYEVATGTKPEPKRPIDELLISQLHETIRVLSARYVEIIEDRFHRDDAFKVALRKWFAEQLWDFQWRRDDFDRAARQAAYLLVNKILFYEALQAKRPELDPLQLPEDLTRGALLEATLQGYFKLVLREIDYETIYTTDFIDSIAFPDAKEVVTEIRELVNTLTRRYNFATLGYDVIGRIFERLIPEDERHKLGQYFTSADVVDLILRFCHTHEGQKVLDPACGAGTFLVRAYQHKQLMNQGLGHEELLAALWGNDIAKFPAHLATINLVVKGLEVDKNYPNILQEDFFALHVGNEGFEAENWRKRRAKTLGVDEREVIYPRWFDVIVGNPPYTRQEEIPEIVKDKEELIRNALKIGSRKLADIGKRAGIHAYFFVHGWKFLRDGGHFGFIVSNSWLDVDYGKGLQEFFLKNYKIVAVIESKVERWFEQADVNTCIVILEKCKDAGERDQNLVRFVHLKKPLRHFIPPAHERWQEQVERLRAIDDLKKTILAHDDLYENDELRIYPKSQKDLWEEGFDAEEGKYVGTKWGKYLRAPDIFFTILRKGKGKLVPFQTIARVKRGYTTGADPWFYVRGVAKTDSGNKATGKHANGRQHKFAGDVVRVESGDGTSWLVEQDYLGSVLRNPDEHTSISVDVKSLRHFVILVNKSRSEIAGELIERYIAHGETRPYQMGKDRTSIPAHTKTCKARIWWYQLPNMNPARLFWQKAFDVQYRHLLSTGKVRANQRFYAIYPKRDRDTELIAAIVNSMVMAMSIELQRSAMGLGAIEATVHDVKRVLVIEPKAVPAAARRRAVRALDILARRAVGSIFNELGASSPDEVTLDTVKPDRRELDRIVMGDILGLTDAEQLEVYRAVLDLVKSRLEKAKSMRNTKKKGGIDVDGAKNSVLERVDEETEE